MSALNFGRLLRRTRLFAHQPALTDLTTRWRVSYGQHIQRVAAIAAALRGLGVTPTDRVAVLAVPTYKYVELWHAGLSGAFIICPLNSRLTGSDLVTITQDSGCKVLLYDETYADLAHTLAAEVGSIEHTIALHDDGSNDCIERLAEEHMGAPLPPEPPESAPAVLMYTGGTTGRSKGVLHSQRSLVTHLFRMQITSGGIPGHKLLSIMPLFHTGAMAAIAWFLPSGGHIHLLPAFNPKAVLHAIDEHSITVIAGAPTMFAMLLEHPDFQPEFLSSLQLAYYGASPMSPKLLAKLLSVNPRIQFFQAYGMTETFGGVTTLRPEDHSVEHSGRLTSVGRPYLDVELEIRDPKQRSALPVGTVGEIWIRSGSNLIEYWRQPALTADSLVDGWYRTGDAGRVDEEGFLYLADRVKDMIVTGGENVYSIEVERALTSLPAVAQAAVIGVSDPIWGERVHAFVVGPVGELSEAELRDNLGDKLASYKIPKTWTIQSEPLPLSAAGKILKTKLREIMTPRTD